MRIYETIYICPPNITDDQMDEFSDLVREIIYDNGGKIIKQENWGRKRLAYEIQKFSDGYYFYFLYGGEKVNIDELERRLRYSDECLRFLTVRLDKELKGKKHKIFTQDELRLALQMESKNPKKTSAKAEESASGNGDAPKAAAAEEEKSEEPTAERHEEPKVEPEEVEEKIAEAPSVKEAEQAEEAVEDAEKETE